MISLKQFWDGRNAVPTPGSLENSERPDECGQRPGKWKPAWESLFFAVSGSASRAVPLLGPALSRDLSALGLPAEIDVGEINGAICGRLGRWSEDANSLYSEHQEELKKIIAAVAKTIESVGHRDERYTNELGGLAAKLRTAADQTDLATIRKSVVESAGAVQNCVARMAHEGRETIRQLKAETEQYRRRTEEAERIALVDPLTGVLNRRGLDNALARLMAAGTPFFVTMLDLDRFKGINDTFGHAAGDDLLRQLSAELSTQFPPPRVVARMGGDEFIVLVPGIVSETERVAAKIESRVLRKYRVPDRCGGKVELSVEGSLGSASWNRRETAAELLARVDKMMYGTKVTPIPA
jgi:diguanylate cyclase